MKTRSGTNFTIGIRNQNVSRKRAPPPGRLAAGDGTAMHQHDLARQGQPDAGPRRLGGEEGQEDLLAQRLVHPRAVVANLDDWPASLGQARLQPDLRSIAGGGCVDRVS
jgi:hypothetical protein